MYDVIVAGAGPAGALAATILARAGARVQMFDRARFPRPKLCGDTLNPGAMRVLAAHLSTTAIEHAALPLEGMVLTGTRVEVRASYPQPLRGRALSRRDLDVLLVDQALAAGVQFDDRVLVTETVMTGARVGGVVAKCGGGAAREHRARLVVAADGRESRLARGAALARHRRRPRRWAIGGYFDGVGDLTAHGEMHVRSGHYIGVAPLPGGLANVCLVIPHDGSARSWRNPSALLTDAVRGDDRLRDRFRSARLIDAPQVLGPMAVDSRAPGVPGMLLAGDAAGFIDPITGDGLHFALAGACLAADVGGEVLAGRLDHENAITLLTSRRRRAFASKWRFNRAIRTVVARPAAIEAAALTARLWPSLFERVITYSGDCNQ